MTVDGETTVNATVLGKALGVSRKRVEQLAAEGVIGRRGKGVFPLLEGVAGYVRWLKDDQRQAAKSAMTSRFQEARAADLEQRTAERNKVLLKQAQAEAISVIDEFYGQLRADLMAIPARITTDLRLRRTIEDEIEGAFASACRRSIAAADLIEAEFPLSGAPTARKPVPRSAAKRARR